MNNFIKQYEKKFDIVIPVYNEGDNIINTINSLLKDVIFEINILIIFDNYADLTLEVIEKNFSKIEFIKLIKNEGQGAHGAVMTGFKYSQSAGVLVLPADDDYNSKNINKYFEKIIEGYDLVCPSRFTEGGCMVGAPKFKYIIMRTVNLFLYYLIGLPTKDSTNGFRLFSNDFLNETKIESKEGFTYSLELLTKATLMKKKIIELPALWYERKHGNSNFKVFKWAFAYLRWVLFSLKIPYKRLVSFSFNL